MALIYADRVYETAPTPGSGSFALAGAVTSWQSFLSAIGNNNTTYYCATDGSSWEVGLGTYRTTGDLLERTSIYDSSNGGSAVNFPAAVDVYTVMPASVLNGTIASNVVAGTATTATTAGYATSAGDADTVDSQHASALLARSNHTGTEQVNDGGTGRTSLTSNAVLIGAGTSAVTMLAAGTNDDVLTIVAGVPTWNAPASSPAVAIDDDDWVPGGTDLRVVNGGTGVSSLTDHGVMLGSGTGNVSVVTEVVSSAKFLRSNAGADPSWETVPGGLSEVDNGDWVVGGTDLSVVNGGTGVSTLTNHGVMLGSGTSDVSVTSVGATNQVLLGVTNLDPVWGNINNSHWSGTDLSVVNGGTGTGSLTDHGVLLGSGTGAVSASSVGTTGNVLLGVNSADPAWGKINNSHWSGTDLSVANGGTGVSTLDDGGVVIGNGTGNVVVLAPPTSAGKVLTSGATGTSDPTWEDPAAASGLGVGQSWSLPTRALGTIYRNTTGNPIQVIVSVNDTPTGDTSIFYCDAASTPITTVSEFQGRSASGENSIHSVIVPDDFYYRCIASTSSLREWAELS